MHAAAVKKAVMQRIPKNVLPAADVQAVQGAVAAGLLKNNYVLQ